MEKIFNHYVEKIFNFNVVSEGGCYREISRVDSRNPLLIEEEKGLIGFRFFDMEERNTNECSFCDLECQLNYSGMYYFGERITYKSLDLVDGDFLKKLQFDYLSRFDLEEAIFCGKTGKVISVIAPEDKTIEEVKNEEVSKKASTIFINQKQFFVKLEEVLQLHGNDVDVVVSDVIWPIADVITGDSIDDMSSIVRIYDLYVDEYKVLGSSAIVNDDRMGLFDKDTYIRLCDALNLVSSLYQEFPYLEKMMYDFKVKLWDKVREESIINNKCLKKHKV